MTTLPCKTFLTNIGKASNQCPCIAMGVKIVRAALAFISIVPSIVIIPNVNYFECNYVEFLSLFTFRRPINAKTNSPSRNSIIPTPEPRSEKNR